MAVDAQTGGVSPMSTAAALRWIILLIAALLAVTGLQQLVSDDPVGSAKARAAPAWGPATYDEAMEMLGREIARGEARVGANPTSWAAYESLAVALHARGQLAGSHRDLAAALEVADTARSFAPERSGPVLSRAVVAMSLHRSDVAASETARMEAFAMPPALPDRSEALAINGDVALFAGDYPRALSLYEQADALDSSFGTQVRIADWHRHMGDFATARAMLTDALDEGGATPWTRAALLLQLGGIDLQSGDWEAAEARFQAADAAFPGWWLSRAHLGQMAATRGEFAAAEALYREAMEGVERPSVMEALAAVLHEMDRGDEAALLEAQAADLWGARVASHPAAYADHAFDAALGEGDEARAWQLASLNYRTRPYGDGRIGLARAAATRGRDESAKAILEELEATGWRAAEQYKTLTEVCERLGDDECAADAREKALAITPYAFDPRSDLLFFSNH